ncbi:STAS-like domain-containing protein [Limosilactobacillus fermentum]
MGKLVVREVIGTTSASTPDRAKPFLDKLCDAIDSKRTTSVDFSGLSTITTAFLNNSIGRLYSLYDVKKLNEYIKLESSSLTPFQREKVQMVMQNTKQKLSQEEIKGEID